MVRPTALSLFVAFILTMAACGANNQKGTVEGNVNSIQRNRSNDLIIGLQGIRGVHYIPAASSGEINPDAWRERLTGKCIRVTYLKPLIAHPMTDTRPVSQVMLGKEVIFEK